MTIPGPPHAEDLEEPLLVAGSAGRHEEREDDDRGERGLLTGSTAVNTNFSPCVLNLTKAIFGAGMMALPRAVTLLGAYLGFGMLGAVGAITWLSISRGLVYPAARLISAEHPGAQGHSAVLHDGYSGLVNSYLGYTSRQVLNFFLLANSIGFSVMYVTVIGDVLLGDLEHPGMVVELLKWLDLPEALQAALLHRPTFIALLMVTAIAPVSLRRSMASLSSLNAIGLCALCGLFGAMTWLLVAAVSSGAAHALPAWPDLDGLAEMSTGSPVLAALSLLAVVLTADGCHLNVMPLAGMMEPAFSPRGLDSITGTALSLVTFFYIAFSGAAYMVFGEDLQADVLQNLSPAAMRPLIGHGNAIAVAYSVRIAYAVSLLGNTALNNFPLRAALFDVLFAGDDAVCDKHFVVVTLGVLALVYVLSVSVTSVWKVVGMVGGLTSTGVCYLFPALLIFAYSRSVRVDSTRAWLRAVGGMLFAMGSGIFINTLGHF
ncbi:hypothetical protein FOA52_008590 [Chlamydomonas sp. UWO 241]|nr:hypothetical protein FOA52_008590 [Chlamydomonas sp. UWO 241]